MDSRALLKQLSGCRINYQAPPRKFTNWDDANRINIPKPDWLAHYPKDNLRHLFDNRLLIFQHGLVTWGQIIQANGMLFDVDDDDYPGEILFSLDDPRTYQIADLKKVAHDLFSLKGKEPEDKALQRIAHYLTDEKIRVFGWQVPKIICPNMNCKISTTYFCRSHLPNRRLSSSFLPIVVYPKDPYFVLPLPCCYWPLSLTTQWY